MTRLSIIIPIHNAEAELPKCLESILRQVGEADRILLIEDSSTDNSGALCDQYAASNPCIQAYHVNFKGPSPTRNYGIEHASGQYIMFVDADDWIEDNAIESLLSKAADHEMVVAGYYMENESEVCKKTLVNRPFLPKEDVITLYSLEMLNVLWNKVFRGDIIRQNNILFDPNLKKGEDLLFVLQYLRHISTPIGIVEQCFYHYISKPTGINRSHRETMDSKRSRMERIVEQFMALVGDKAQCAQHMLNLYFRHIRDYLAAESSCSIFGKLSFIKKEARHSIVAEILRSQNSARIRLLRFLHSLRLDVVMFMFNRLFL